MWAYASVTITEFNHVHWSRWYSDIFNQMHLFQHPPYSQYLWACWHFSNHLVDIILEMKLSQHPLIHITCGHDDISAIAPVISIILSRTSSVFTAPVDMVTFRQSHCWYYPWADVAVSTSTDTQHLWTWWHFGDHAGLINLSVNNIHRIHTRRSH